MPAVEYGWLKDGVGDGSCTSAMLMLAQMEALLESADDAVTLGLEGSTRHESTGAGIVDWFAACVHMLKLAGELGSSGGWRMTSTTRGGGGNSGFMRLMMLLLTSSLLPLSSSPA